MSRKSGLVFRELLVTGIMCYILAWLLKSFQLGTSLANCCHSLIKKDNDYDSIEDQTLRIGVILKNVASSSEKSQTLLLQFIIMIRSLLKNLSCQYPSEMIPQRRIRLSVMTDTKSSHCVSAVLSKFIDRDVSRLPCLKKPGAIIPDVDYELLDVGSMLEDYTPDIVKIRKHFVSDAKMAAKYSDYLFMIAPFYHKIFTTYKRMILLDADLKFVKTDVSSLYDQFSSMRKNGQLIGVGLDLSPHYSVALAKFRKLNPGTPIGSPGRFQGFNTGVVLYDLEAMRDHNRFNHMISNADGSLDQLASKYHFRSHLGDQCLFTLLGMEYPSWFLHLSCDWNYQLDVSLGTQKEFEGVFNRYHNCTLYPKILHGNGNTPIPEDNDEYFYGQFGKFER